MLLFSNTFWARDPEAWGPKKRSGSGPSLGQVFFLAPGYRPRTQFYSKRLYIPKYVQIHFQNFKKWPKEYICPRPGVHARPLCSYE